MPGGWSALPEIALQSQEWFGPAPTEAVCLGLPQQRRLAGASSLGGH